MMNPIRQPAALTRRVVLAGALGAAAGSWSPVAMAADAEKVPTLPGAGEAFEANTLTDLARARAKAPYTGPKTADLPAVLKNLSRDAYEAIHPVEGRAIWADQGIGYSLEPLLRGSIFDTPVSLFLVENGLVTPISYDKASFSAPGIDLPDLDAETAFSGLRLRARFSDGGALADFALLQGGSFFRLVAEGQDFGINARALALRPADARGEEFPLFRALFIETPAPGQPIIVHALAESESATAAFKLTLTPGREASVAGIDGTVFARADLDHIGLGGMQGSYLFGPLDRRRVDDLRAAAFSVEGLAIHNGYGEPIWRPVHNPETLQVSAFVDRAPKGFGLMQRARAYHDFDDDRRHWEQRPSLWLEPLDDWNEGAVTLLEIPSDSELNENIFAYWRPKAKLAKGGEMRFLCRQHWSKGWPDPLPPEIARVIDSRCGHGSAGNRRLFAVDFQGDTLFGPGDIDVDLSASAGTITRQDQYRYPDRRTLRILFELDPGNERASELRLALRRGQARASETWLFRWTP
ncbi:glucans biosynthesis protein [Methylobacterium phyllostachyos]|uniref:Glucans biosynthesis protein n=1 Tax=Methylobacterium phyllostachyos TaxID=582672 RepID=A0A1G9Z3E8_9HYPH|nr:glucan biosynthesis protein D [Methylobacterium phyllostachyos]SDN15253.1 glucans biosynthesis protein [Methylobacterium phyllostachyos]